MDYQKPLSFEQFEETVRETFISNYEEGVTVNIRTVLKNNGVKLRGLTVFRQGDKVTPTIYLEDFYQFYLRGTSLERVLQDMQTIYAERKQSQDIQLDYFYQYDSVKDTLRIKLINYEKNLQLLENVPHLRFLDLAVICYSLMESSSLENGSITIYEKHMQMWNVTKEQMFTDAVLNSRKYSPDRLMQMSVLFENLQKELPEELLTEMIKNKPECSDIHVLTNEQKLNGAAVIFYPNVLEQCALCLDSDFYVLPSSIHETILVPVLDGDREELISMVQEVNDGQVADEEILSYHVYQYRRSDGVLEDLLTGDCVKVRYEA